MDIGEPLSTVHLHTKLPHQVWEADMGSVKVLGLGQAVPSYPRPPPAPSSCAMVAVKVRLGDSGLSLRETRGLGVVILHEGDVYCVTL